MLGTAADTFLTDLFQMGVQTFSVVFQQYITVGLKVK